MTADGVRWAPAALSAFADAVTCLHTTYFRGGAADPRAFLTRTTTSAPPPAASDNAPPSTSSAPTVEAITTLQDIHEDLHRQFAAQLTVLSEALLDMAERARASSRAMTAADRAAAARLARLQRPAPAANPGSHPQGRATSATGWPPTILGSAPTDQPGPQPPPHHTNPTNRPIGPVQPAPPPLPPPAHTAAHAAAPLHQTTHLAPPDPAAANRLNHTTEAADHPSAPSLPPAAVIPPTLAAAAAASAAACDPRGVEPDQRSRGTTRPSTAAADPTVRTAAPSAEQSPRGAGLPTPAGHPVRRKPHEPREQRRTSAHTPAAMSTPRFAGTPSPAEGRNTTPQTRPADHPVSAAPPPDPDARLTALADEFPAARAALLAARHLLAGRT